MRTAPFALRNPGLRARIGVARADITPAPDAPINNWGASTHRRATGIADPLTLTVVTVAPIDGGDPVVVASLDLGWWRTDAAFQSVRSSLAASAGVAPERVVLALTHTHAGPAIDPEGVQAPERPDVEAYLARLVDTARDAVTAALADAAPALLEWGLGACLLARHRDEPRRGEGVVCGYEPATQVSQDLLVGRVLRDGDDVRRPYAVLVHYAAHPTTLGPENSLISPDYLAGLRAVVEAETGSPALFLQGASGDLGTRRQYRGDTAVAEANGRQLGYAVLSTLAGMMPPATRLEPLPTVQSGAPLGIWGEVPDSVDASVATYVEQVSLPANSAVGAWSRSPELSDAARAERAARAALVGTEAAMPLHVVRLGDVVLVAMPGEAYSHLQQQLDAEFPEHPVLVVGLSGGRHHGYLPPEDRYGTDLYQVWQTPAGAGSLEAVGERATELVTAALSPCDPPGDSQMCRPVLLSQHPEGTNNEPTVRPAAVPRVDW